MFASTFTVATLALSVVGSASALHVPRKAAPAGWWFEGLENYDVYHTRYLALNCQSQHNTDFFDLCCHPMLNTENLVDNRDPSCTPSTAASSSASAAEPTSTVDTGDEGFDNSDNSSDNSGDNSDDNEDYDDDEEWECDDDDESSSAEPAPTTSVWSTSEDTPKPTTTKEAKPTTTKEAKPTTTKEAESTTTKEATPTTTEEAEPTSGDDSGSGGAYPGTITFYSQGGVAGACGDFHSDNDDIAAIAFGMYGDIGAKSALCGQKLQISNPANGNSVTVTIADACEACKDTQIDLSTGAFNKLADPNLGLVDVTIQWL
jgi:hypothetical protein